MEINNEIYNQKKGAWWDDDGDDNLVPLRFLNNPIKFNYIKTTIDEKLNVATKNKAVLDVGCGGGYLSEELAKIRLEVTGIDPSNEAVEAAKLHAKQEKLDIKYYQGFGEELPFESDSFDFVCCCDVLEHVKDLKKVISEISRVLKTGGVFFYDTINRTLISKIVMIKVMQEWKSTAFLDPNVHIWNMFIKPNELVSILKEYKLTSQEIKGLSASMNFPAHFLNLRKRAKGKLSWQELGKRLNLRINNNLAMTYLGYATKVE